MFFMYWERSKVVSSTIQHDGLPTFRSASPGNSVVRKVLEIPWEPPLRHGVLYRNREPRIARSFTRPDSQTVPYDRVVVAIHVAVSIRTSARHVQLRRLIVLEYQAQHRTDGNRDLHRIAGLSELPSGSQAGSPAITYSDRYATTFMA